MENLTKKEVESAVERIFTKRNKAGRTWYLDRLKSGKFGVSCDEHPFFKFKKQEDAKSYIERRVNPPAIVIGQLNTICKRHDLL